MNEMFVSLRVNAQGRVGPSFVLRQNVMSSPAAAEALQERGWSMTSFTDVPRWVISPKLFSGEKLGPSDSMHFNYVKVQGIDLPGDLGMPLNIVADALSPAMADLADIKRSGLRPAVIQTNCDISGALDLKGQLGRAFTQFMTDILMDQHLKWSGTLNVKGIQEPIAVGDNCEWDEVIYHIEGVTHSGHIDQAGRKTFNTTLSLSNGVSVATEDFGDNVMPYEAVSKDSHTDYETKSTVKDLELESGAMFDQEMERNLKSMREQERAADREKQRTDDIEAYRTGRYVSGLKTS
jgi:hypothetical protein